MSSPRKVGILGGTFDPPHYGHLMIAEEARVRLGLAQVIFAPAGGNPLKVGAAQTSPAHRLAMVRLAIQSNSHFAATARDLERTPSYTADLLARLQGDMADADLHFIIGADALARLTEWREPARVLELARLVAVARPGIVLDLSPIYTALPAASERIITLKDSPQLDISSSDLRQRVAASLPIRYQLPDAVAEYVAKHKLYLSANEEG